MGLFGYSSRYLAVIPWPSFAMPNEVTWRVYLFSINSKDILVPINDINKTPYIPLLEPNPAWDRGRPLEVTLARRRHE
jgi:hypothetical protein